MFFGPGTTSHHFRSTSSLSINIITNITTQTELKILYCFFKSLIMFMLVNNRKGANYWENIQHDRSECTRSLMTSNTSIKHNKRNHGVTLNLGNSEIFLGILQPSPRIFFFLPKKKPVTLLTNILTKQKYVKYFS